MKNDTLRDFVFATLEKRKEKMAVFRVEKIDNYTILSNHHFKDYCLSWKAKGLLSNMLSLPEDWDYSAKGLSKLSSDGIDSTRSGLKELEEKGYLFRKPIKEKGRVVDWVYDIYEVSQLEHSERDKSDMENPDVKISDEEKPSQLRTNISTTKGSRTKRSNASEEAVVYYPLDNKLNSVLIEFIEHRKNSKRPMTETAINLLIKKLNEMTDDNNEKIAILEQSIINGWIGISALKEKYEKQSKNRNSAANDFFEIAEEFAEDEGGFIL